MAYETKQHIQTYVKIQPETSVSNVNISNDNLRLF